VRLVSLRLTVTEADTLRGAALLQRGAEDLVAIARGTTGTGPETDCSLGTRFQIASVTKPAWRTGGTA
jgi:hypothetical protein